MRRETRARRSGVLAAGVVWLILPSSSLLATTANDVCSPSANPCVVSGTVAVDSGSTLDFGSRALRVAAAGTLNVGSGMATILAGAFTIDMGGAVRAVGTASSPGGKLVIQVASATLKGTLDASGTPGGEIDLTATGSISGSGSTTARALERSASGGIVSFVAATAMLSGPFSVLGGPDGDGGQITVETTGNQTVSNTLDSSGGDGGGIDVHIIITGGGSQNVTGTENNEARPGAADG
jgi:hypothetical protein